MADPRPHFPVGTRVRHYGQQYPSAHANGTGNVAAVEGPYRDGSWEYLIYHDANGFTSGPSWWSSLRTIPVREACRG